MKCEKHEQTGNKTDFVSHENVDIKKENSTLPVMI